MIKLLGIMDLIIALIFILVQWDIGLKYAVIAAIYLIVKGIIFLSEFMSKIDLLLGVYILLMGIFHFTSFMDFFIYGWFLYKFVFTLVGMKS